MFNKKSALIILIIFFLPIVNAELQPAFLDENIHFLGEEINFGLVGIIPDDFNHVNFEIIMPNDYSYTEATLDLENLSDYYITFPSDFIHSQVNVKYIYYNSNNTETLNQEYTLQFTKFPTMENIKYCINEECRKMTFETLDINVITLNTQTEITDENVNFDIRVIQEGYIIENTIYQKLPYNLDTTPGAYEIEITPKYNDKKFETTTLSLTIVNSKEDPILLEDYLLEIREQKEAEEQEKQRLAILNNGASSEISETEEETKIKSHWWIIGVAVLVVAIILSIIIFNKPKIKNKTPNTKENRRERRKERVFLFFFVLLLVLSSVHALTLEEKQKEYQNLEITFNDFNTTYPYPANLSIPVTNTQTNATVYYPISATGLSDFEKINTTLENKTKNMSVSLESVYLSVNIASLIEKARTENKKIQVESGCEQVLEWFQKNPITSDPRTISARTKDNLLKNIEIIENKNGYTDNDKKYIKNKIQELKKNSKYKKSINPYVEYCITDYLKNTNSVLEEKYLTEKKILLKIEYVEENQEAITNNDLIIDKVIFQNTKGKDVLENAFLGSDLNHISVWVDYTANALKEQNLEITGIPLDRIIRTDNIINGETIKNYFIPVLAEGENTNIKYSAQLINLEILDSDYGNYYQFAEITKDTSYSPEKKGHIFAISDKSLADLRKKIITNIELTGNIKLNNGAYELNWSQETLNLLAEVNLNPTKFIVLDKKIIIDVGEEASNISIGIDKDYGIISFDSTGATILLEEDKTISFAQTPNNLHLEVLKKIFLKTSTQKNIELIRLQLPLLFIFDFKKNAQTITNDDELYLKTYDDLADIIKNTTLTKLEKNIIFNNLISLTEDFCFQKPGGELYKFKLKTRLALNYGLIKYIDNPKTIDSLVPENIPAAIPYLYDNDYLERKGFVDKSLTELLVLGYLGENYSSKNSIRQIDPAFDNLAAYEFDLKSQIQEMFVALKADYQNWGYYKQLISYPFYRTGFEQKICSYDKENFPKYALKDYCYIAYNLNPETDNWGTLYDSSNLQSGFLMQDWAFQNNYASAYRTILLLEDIESFKNNKLVFNQNQLKTYNKLNAFFNLIELEATRNRGAYGTTSHGPAIVLSYKLKEIWNGNANELKQYDTSNNIGAQIDNTINALTYQAAVKLRSTIASDRILRLDAYKSIYQTDAHRYEDSINVSAGLFDLSDSARFLITGGWFQTLIFKGSENEIKKIESKEREKYNKLLNGACCIAQRLGELEEVTAYKNWTVAEIKGTYSPYSKSKNLTKGDVIGWATEGAGCIGLTGTSSTECSKDILNIYNSKEYGKDISIILNDTKDKKSISNYLTPHYNLQLEYSLDIDQSIQLNSTERELKEKVAELKPGTIGSILRFIDAGINPLTIIITVATVGIGHGLATGTGGFFTRVASGFSAKLGSSTAGSLASTVSTRVLYELGENVVIDGAYGALAFKSPEFVGKHPFLTCIVLGIVVGNFNRPLANLDNAARGMATDIITNAGLKNADNLKIQNAIKTSLNLDYKDTTSQLLKLRRGEAATDAFFRKLPKMAAGTVDDELVTSIQKNLLSQKISVSEDVIRKSLGNNNLYLTTRATAVSKFFKSKQGIQLKTIAAANADITSNKFVKLATERVVPERFGVKFTNIADEFEDLKRFNEIDSEHFAKPTKIIYDDLGNPLGYEMEKVSGITLADYIEDGGVLDDSFYKRIENSVDKLHKQGFAHGDINPSNIIIRETYDGLDFTIIDPVGFRRIADNVNLRNSADAIFNDDISKVRNLKNYTTADKLYYQTNKIIPENIWELQRIQQADEFIPVRRSSGKTTMAKIRSISDNGEQMVVEFTENGQNFVRNTDYKFTEFLNLNKDHEIIVRGYGSGRIIDIKSDKTVTFELINGKIVYTDLDTVMDSAYTNNPFLNKNINITNNNGKSWTLWADNDMEVYTPVRKRDIVDIDGVGTGHVVDLDEYGTVTIKLNNGTITYTNIDAVINSRKINSYLSKINSTDITPKNLESFTATNQKLPERFVYINRKNWDGREVILVDKFNDPILIEYLERVKRNANTFSDSTSKIDAAFSLVEDAMPVYKTMGTDLLENVVDYSSIKGKVIPLGYFINNKVGVCRHKALLLKLTLDEMGIESVIRRGDQEYFINGVKKSGGHAWIEVKLKGENLLLDPMQHKKIPFNTRPTNYIVKGDLELYKPITEYSGFSKININKQFNLELESAIKNVYIPDGASISVAVKQFNDAGYRVSENDLRALIKKQADIVTNLSRDPVLSNINQNIDAIGGVFSFNKTTPELKNSIITELRKNNITLQIVDDGFVQNATKAPKNYATLFYDTKTGFPIIQIEKSATEYDGPFLREIRHEYGAHLLMKNAYDYKGKIPKALIITKGKVSNDSWMTHYLDHVSDGWASEGALIN